MSRGHRGVSLFHTSTAYSPGGRLPPRTRADQRKRTKSQPAQRRSRTTAAVLADQGPGTGDETLRLAGQAQRFLFAFASDSTFGPVVI